MNNKVESQGQVIMPEVSPLVTISLRYRVNDGQRVSEINSAVAPTAIPPVGTRFLGFVPNGTGVVSGSTVLADLEDGHVLEVLNPAAHVLNQGYFSDDTRENRTKGSFISFAFTSDAMTEISQFFKRSGKSIIPLTVKEILDEEIAQKLA
jgi:hypothetical protein